jgi:hypothetical protein
MNWEDDTRLSDLAREAGLVLDWPWTTVATVIEQWMARFEQDGVLHYTVYGHPAIDLEFPRIYDEQAATLGIEVDELDDFQKREAVLKAIIEQGAQG